MRIESSGTVSVFFPRHDRDTILQRLAEDFHRLAAELPLRRLVLFGSWARGAATVSSDIDILVVYDGPPRDDAYRIVRDAIELHGLEPHIYTASEAEALSDTIERMTSGGVEIRPEPDKK